MEDDIFRYLNSEMSPSEESEFRQRMSEDAELREHVENMSLLKASFQASDIEAEITRQKKKRKIIAYCCTVAASLLILVVCGYRVLDVKSYNSAKATICLQNIELSAGVENQDLLRGTESVNNAIRLYYAGDVDGALSILNDLTENPGLHNPSDAYFVKGVILLKQDGLDSEAVKCLEKSDNPQAKELLESLKHIL